MAGIFSFRMLIQKIEDGDDALDWKDFDCWVKKPPMRGEAIKIRAYIY